MKNKGSKKYKFKWRGTNLNGDGFMSNINSIFFFLNYETLFLQSSLFCNILELLDTLVM